MQTTAGSELRHVPVKGSGLFNPRWFGWGVGFWMLAWIVSICLYGGWTLHLIGSWQIRVEFGWGSLVGTLDTTPRAGPGIAFPYFSAEKPVFLWNQPYVDFHRFPGDILGWLGNISSTGDGLSIPVAGFLVLWLIRGWLGYFKKSGWSRLLESGSSIRRIGILVALSAILWVSNYKFRRLREAAGCLISVRSLQQAVRGYQGVNSMRTGDRIHWDKIVGPAGYMSEAYLNCPSDEHYRLKKSIPEPGELVAECPNPDHQQRIKLMNTSDW